MKDPKHTETKERWGSEFGFIISSIGAAVGLGNLWRFTYKAGENDGGTFLIPYLIILGTFGLSMLLIEFSVGRHFHAGVISSLAAIKKKFWIIGLMIVVNTSLILSYYLVIVGWVLSYLAMYVFGIRVSFQEYSNTPYPFIAFIVIILINFAILRAGVKKGIERVNKIAVIMLIALIVPMTIWATTLPEAMEGLEFFLIPDVSELDNPSIWTDALGQVFFSVAGAQGILVAYGSYLRGKASILKNSIIIAGGNAMFSFIAGIFLFSTVFAFGLGTEGGVSILFETLPETFGKLPASQYLGIVFFFLLSTAGITSSIAMFQVPISALEETTKKIDKEKAVIVVMIGIFCVGSFSALSYSNVELTVFDKPVLDTFDDTIGTYGLAIVSTVFLVAITWFMDKDIILGQINQQSRIKIPKQTITIARFVLPAITIIAIVSTIVKI